MGRKLRVLEVEWLDAGSLSGWRQPTEHADEGPLRCRTVGYVLRDDEECLILAQSQASSGQVAASLTIPRSCIKKRRRL